MTISYDILFRVTIHHSFYLSGLSGDFDFVPTPGTQKLLDTYNLVFKPFDHGFTVFTRVEPGTAPPKLFYPIHQGSLRFSFLMVANNSNFYNYTKFYNNKLPRPGNEILYFSNVSMLAADAPGLGDKVSAAPGTYLQLLNRNVLNLKYTTPVNASTPALEDMFGKTYTPVPAISLPPGKTTDELQIDMSKVQETRPGRYRISDANLSSDVHLWYEPELGGQDAFGVIDIFSDTNDFINPVTAVVDPAYKFLNNDLLNRNGAALVADYQIQFDPSAFELRYLIQIKPETLGTFTSADLQINNFSGVTNGSDQAVFTSDALINWSEALQNFILRDTGANTIKSLPNPTVFHPLKKHPNPTPPDDEILYYDLNIYV